jgi:hypothetical protein
MSSHSAERVQVVNGIITQEEANELMGDALDAQYDEPEQLVKLLVILHDNSEGYIQEAVYRLIRAAYNLSLVHSFSLQDYMAVIREGRDPLAEARRKSQKVEARAEVEATRKEKKKKSKRKKSSHN